MSSMYKCPNCGAEMDKKEPKCPFCGYINEEGAEKQYMEKLDDVRERLDNVDEEAAAEYGRSYKKMIRIIVITVVVLAILTAIGFGLYRVVENKVMERGNASGEDALKEMTWQKENFPKFDELYEAEKYDELTDLFYGPECEGHSLYDYKHYDFLRLYLYYQETRHRIERVDDIGWTETDANLVMLDSFTLYYELYKSGYEKLDPDEIERIEPVREYMAGIIHDRFGYTDEDMERLRKRVLNDYDNIEYDRCAKVVKEDIGQYK